MIMKENAQRLMNDISIINNVKIETDENGNQHFTPIEQPKPTIVVDNRSWWQKICDWWNDAPVKPYVKIRNLSDPFDDKHYEGETHKAIETGIEINF